MHSPVSPRAGVASFSTNHQLSRSRSSSTRFFRRIFRLISDTNFKFCKRQQFLEEAVRLQTWTGVLKFLVRAAYTTNTSGTENAVPALRQYLLSLGFNSCSSHLKPKHLTRNCVPTRAILVRKTLCSASTTSAVCCLQSLPQYHMYAFFQLYILPSFFNFPLSTFPGLKRGYPFITAQCYTDRFIAHCLCKQQSDDGLLWYCGVRGMSAAGNTHQGLTYSPVLHRAQKSCF